MALTPRAAAAAFQRRLDLCDQEPPRPYPVGVILDRATFEALSRWCYADHARNVVVFGDTPVYRETGPAEAERWTLEEPPCTGS